jgi:uncharacterized protein YndB with AHSA1/START domain
MRSPLTVTSERRIAASPAVVWSVIASTAFQDSYNARCRVESVVGGDGEVGSEYVVAVTTGMRVVRMRTVVVAAEPGRLLATEIWRGASKRGEQRAELCDDSAGTLLRWSILSPTWPPFRRLVAALMGRELRRWLDAVEGEALAVGRLGT